MNDRRDFLTLCALGARRDGLELKLIEAVEERGGEVYECHAFALGDNFAFNLLVGGHWSALGRVETALPTLAQELELELKAQRCRALNQAPEYRPYAADVVAPRQDGLLTQLLEFFRDQAVRVTETHAQRYESAHTGAPMCNVQLALQVPVDLAPQGLRESFMDLCDELGADGVLDPVKN